MYLLALKCLVTAHAIDPVNPTFHEQLVRFRQALDSSRDLDPKVSEVLKSNSNIVPLTADLSSFNDTYLSEHRDSAPHVQSALRVRALLGPSSKPQNETELLKTLELPDISTQQAEDGLRLLKQWKSDATVREKYEEAARGKWPRATAFAKS